MARLSKDKWESLKADYITGVYTLEMLAKKYSIDKSAISRRAKKEEWEKIEPKETAELVEMEKVKKSQNQKVNKIANSTKTNVKKIEKSIKEITDVQEYIHSLQYLATEKVKETLQDGNVEEIVSISGENATIDVIERRLNPKELKSLVDAIDKAGQTLGVVPRFGQQVNIQNNQLQQNQNTLKVEWIEVKDENK